MPTAPSTSQHRNLAWVWIRVSDTADRRYWMGVALIGAALVVGGACSSPSRDGRAELCRGGRVIGMTYYRQIVGVGRPAVSPVHDVMNIEPAVVRATGHTAATISPFDDPSSSFRNRSLCSTDAERNAIPFPDGLNDSVAADQVEQTWRNSVTVRERCRFAVEMHSSAGPSTAELGSRRQPDRRSARHVEMSRT